MVLIDTDVLLKCLSGDPVASEEVLQLLESQAAILTPIQVAEVLTLCLQDEMPTVSAFIGLFKQESFDTQIAETAGEFMQQYSQHYPDLTITDCLLGALAATKGFDVYTTHPKHYPMTQVSLYRKVIEEMTAKTKDRLDNFVE